MSGGRVAFDVTIARTNRMGSGMYARRLLEALCPLMGERLSPIDFRFATPLTHRKTIRDRAATLAHDLWWTQVAALAAARACDAKLLHMPAMLAPLRSPLPVVLTVHDLAIIRFPEKYRVWHRTSSRFFLPRLVHRVNAIVTGSEATKADLVELLDVEPERVHVIPYGVGGKFSPPTTDDHHVERVRQRYALPRDFLMTVGTIEPRKNLVRLLKAVEHLTRSQREFAKLHLVHVGPMGWRSEDVPRTVASLGLQDRVHFLGFVPEDDLLALYHLARAAVYPSVFEGFGFPVLEAMASGCPVVTSNCSSLPEVAGDAAVLVDPTSIESIAGGIARLWEDDVQRQELSCRGLRRAAEFSWERTARQTMSLYDRVLAST
jgi:glycosyltransferase involved in cell wall biosynthesis